MNKLHMQYLSAVAVTYGNCVQAANSTTGIKHVYTMHATLWKYFYYSPKRAESWKEIQHVLNLPEMKVIKPSDTCWLADEWCVKAVKASCTALVATLDINYQNFHAPETLGLCKALSKFTTITAIYLLNYTLPLVAKLSKSLQAKQYNLSKISSLINAVFHAWMMPLLQQHSVFWNFGFQGLPSASDGRNC